MLLNNKIRIYNGLVEDKVVKLAQEAGISKLLAKVFLSRGINDIEYINKFISPSMSDLHNPFLLKDMSITVDRIINAIENKEKILIYGDYDVDGVTCTSILYHFLSSMDSDVNFYIPDRVTDGYGLSKGALQKLISEEYKLIISVDCGTTAIPEVDFINENGVDIIITDHHQCKESLPNAFSIINPTRPDCEYPFKQLAGVGVVYKLITALSIALGLDDVQNNYLDLVALGTIADVVPLVDENRIIAKYGLKMMENTPNIGLKTLIENTGLAEKTLNAWMVGFIIGPRINAAGRIGDATRAVKLFTTNSLDEALKLVDELNYENNYRQQTETNNLEEALDFIENNIDLKCEKVIVVHGKGWHQGVIGIVASRICEKFSRPCIVLALEEGLAKGSGRSIDGLNLFNALDYCKNLLEEYGGHELAAGLSIKEENINRFREKINEYADKFLTDQDLFPRVCVDVNIRSDEVTLETVKELELLAPYGPGNPTPVFEYSNLFANEIKTVGENKHLKIKLRDKNFFADAIGFNMGELAEKIKNFHAFDIIGCLEINSWNNIERVQFNLKDIRLNDDILLKYAYYRSLEHYISREELNPQNNIEVISPSTILNNVLKARDIGKKVVVVTNSYDCIQSLKGILTKSLSNIKKQLKICYTNFNVFNIDGIDFFLNPCPETTDFNKYDKVVFYGIWLGKKYFSSLLAKSNNVEVTVAASGRCNIKKFIECIVPVRSDFEAVYRQLKNEETKTILIEDLLVFARKVSTNYGVRMNCYKLKKCIEIFEEVGLVRAAYSGDFSVTISLVENKRANLYDSIVYKKLRGLNEYLGGI